MKTVKRVATSAVKAIVAYLHDMAKNIKGVILMTAATAGIASFLVSIGLATVGALATAGFAVLMLAR